MPRRILIDRDAAYRLFGILISALRRKLPPYDKAIPVKGPAILPKSIEYGSVAHGRFSMLSCSYMRGRINSGTAIQKLAALHDLEPWMFDPENFQGQNGDTSRVERKIIDALVANGLGFDAESVSKYWNFNLSKLTRHWDGNPARFYQSDQNYSGLCAILFQKKDNVLEQPTGFFGFRHKMASMLTYFLDDAGIIDPPMYPVPVDFHILRILVSSGVLFSEDIEAGSRFSVDYLSRAARELTIQYCIDTGTKPMELADALWHLSREFCKWNPSNSSSVSREYYGRKTGITVREVKWTENQMARFHRTCGQCQIRASCKWAVPYSNYYIQGVLVVRGPHHVPPDLFAHAQIAVPAVFPRSKPKSEKETGIEGVSDSNQDDLFD